ncbi:TetR/AcrR family transcriptional regulator [Nocardia sp. alder85J]|uniref:TetR/AcrR family transcriptional regulator n=1 Tax=Nocardia sp. alder85J TaxID=2862949 RepID=UPI001CD24EC6|nr:TetR/AcrR family transcriptional regulator [Nocardia sp. alder85J]MCX4092406.1 helix-turn-helix domain containing protein [Nocardia sp. alder85J]
MSEQGSRRRGPRSDVDVRELILDVTEAMAGHTNPDAVSLRAIAREANIAPRALSYHFPTKRSLLEAVVRRRSGAISASITERLIPLRDRAGAVTVREAVDALLTPIVELIEREPVVGVRWMRVFLTFSQTEDFAHFVPGFDPGVSRLFTEVTQRALGDAPTAGGRRRVVLGMLSMLETLTRVDQPVYGRPLRESGLDPDFVEQLAVFTSAGIAGTC